MIALLAILSLLVALQAIRSSARIITALRIDLREERFAAAVRFASAEWSARRVCELEAENARLSASIAAQSWLTPGRPHGGEA